MSDATSRDAIGRNSALLAGAALASRLLGWVRLTALAVVFGVSGALDPFLAAFRLPDLLYQLIAAGAIASAIVPAVAGLVASGERERASRLLTTLALLVGGGMALLGGISFVEADRVAQLVAPGLSPLGIEQTATLTRMLLFSPLFLGLAAVANAAVAAEERFRGPALGPLLYNLAVIVAVLLFGATFGAIAPAAGTVSGAILLLIVSLPEAHRAGFRIRRPNFADPILRRTLLAIAPRVIGLAAIQFVFAAFVSTASNFAEGSITAWNYAFSLLQFPVATIGGAIGTALLPAASRLVATADRTGLARAAHGAFGTAIWLILPVACIGQVIAPGAVAVTLGPSADPLAVERTAMLLRLLFLGVPAMAATAVFTRLCYSVGDTRGPVGAALTGVAVMLTAQALLAPSLELGSLAAAVAIGEWFECAILLARVRSRVAGPTVRGFLAGVPICIALSAVAALIALGIVTLAAALSLTSGWLSSALVTMLAGGVSLFAYLAGTALYGIRAAAPILRRVVRIAPRLKRLPTVRALLGDER
ncbi:MAG: murein biosynthesis integral membrane protein MurJ [Candidatus Limnocylindrus sp.]|jgi:putative peptidoglycan lipid II flippase